MVEQKLAGLPRARKMMKQYTHGVLLEEFAVAKLKEKSNGVYVTIKLAQLSITKLILLFT